MSYVDSGGKYLFWKPTCGRAAKFYRLAYSYLHHQEDALDAVQTAVCRALERQDSLRDPHAVRTWFLTIFCKYLSGHPAAEETDCNPLGVGGGRAGGPMPPIDHLARQIDALPAAVSNSDKACGL